MNAKSATDLQLCKIKPMTNPYARVCVMCGSYSGALSGVFCGGVVALAIIDGGQDQIKLYIFSSAGAREGHPPP